MKKKSQRNEETWREHTVTSGIGVELCLDDHVGDKIGSLSSFFEKLLNLCLGAHVPVLLKLLP